jgi:hypothetical protein
MHKAAPRKPRPAQTPRYCIVADNHILESRLQLGELIGIAFALACNHNVHVRIMQYNLALQRFGIVGDGSPGKDARLSQSD